MNFKRYTTLASLLAILLMVLTGCVLFFDDSGDGALRYADSRETTYELTVHSEYADDCYLNVLLNDTSDHWVLTIEQWPFAPCRNDFRYTITNEDGNTFETVTLNGYERFSWIVYDNFDTYKIWVETEASGTSLIGQLTQAN